MSGIFKTFASVLCTGIVSATLAYACPIASVIVKGRIEKVPQHAIVRVELVYARGQIGDSADTTLENESFTVKVPFSTQSRAPVLIGNLLEKCNRKPKTVIVSLLSGGQEYDRLSLALAKDFTTPFPGAYTPRSEIVLHGMTTTWPASLIVGPRVQHRREVI